MILPAFIGSEAEGFAPIACGPKCRKVETTYRWIKCWRFALNLAP